MAGELDDKQLGPKLKRLHLFILGEFSVHIWDTGFQNRPVKKRLQINNFTHYYINKMKLVGVNVYLFSGRKNSL